MVRLVLGWRDNIKGKAGMSWVIAFFTEEEITCSKSFFYTNLIHLIQFKYLENRCQAFRWIIFVLSKQHTEIFNPLLRHVLVLLFVLHYKYVFTQLSQVHHGTHTPVPQCCQLSAGLCLVLWMSVPCGCWIVYRMWWKGSKTGYIGVQENAQ